MLSLYARSLKERYLEVRGLGNGERMAKNVDLYGRRIKKFVPRSRRTPEWIVVEDGRLGRYLSKAEGS